MFTTNRKGYVGDSPRSTHKVSDLDMELTEGLTLGNPVGGLVLLLRTVLGTRGCRKFGCIYLLNWMVARRPAVKAWAGSGDPRRTGRPAVTAWAGSGPFRGCFAKTLAQQSAETCGQDLGEVGPPPGVLREDPRPAERGDLRSQPGRGRAPSGGASRRPSPSRARRPALSKRRSTFHEFSCRFDFTCFHLPCLFPVIQ